MEEQAEKDRSDQGAKKTFNILWKAGNQVAKSMTLNNLISAYGYKLKPGPMSPSHRKSKTAGKQKEKSAHKVRSKSPRKKIVGSESPARQFIKPMKRHQTWRQYEDKSSDSSSEDRHDDRKNVLNKDLKQKQKQLLAQMMI